MAEDLDTRATIVRAARELMFERGFDATTMRAIADRAGVSLGNAYYYFAGKDDLIQGFYEEIAAAHQVRVREATRGKRGLGDRITASLEVLVGLCEEYAPVADALLTRGISPAGPLNPFSAQSSRPRELFLETSAELVEGARVRTDAELRAALPELLWLVQLAVTLGWVQDLSEDKAGDAPLGSAPWPDAGAAHLGGAGSGLATVRAHNARAACRPACGAARVDGGASSGHDVDKRSDLAWLWSPPFAMLLSSCTSSWRACAERRDRSTPTRAFEREVPIGGWGMILALPLVMAVPTFVRRKCGLVGGCCCSCAALGCYAAVAIAAMLGRRIPALLALPGVHRADNR